MVGFFPYQQLVPETLIPESLLPQPHLDYAMELVQPGSGHYVVLSSRAAFVHKEYLESFHSAGDNACHQFALSIHCTAVSSKAPLAVAADPQEQRTSDLVHSLGSRRIPWKQEEVSSCLWQWVEGHEMKALPTEDSTYLGA